ARLRAGDRVAVLVNNLGGTPAMELAVVARRALANLEGRGLRVERAYAGTFLSALEMAGGSISVLRVDAARLARLDAPTGAPARPSPAAAARPRAGAAEPEPAPAPVPGPAPAAPQTPAAPAAPRLPKTEMERAVEASARAAAGALIDSAPRLTEMDRAVGDG